MRCKLTQNVRITRVFGTTNSSRPHVRAVSLVVRGGLTRFITDAGTQVYPYSSAQRYVLWDESVEAWLRADIMIAECRKISFNDVGNKKNV